MLGLTFFVMPLMNESLVCLSEFSSSMTTLQFCDFKHPLSGFYLGFSSWEGGGGSENEELYKQLLGVGICPSHTKHGSL